MRRWALVVLGAVACAPGDNKPPPAWCGGDPTPGDNIRLLGLALDGQLGAKQVAEGSDYSQWELVSEEAAGQVWIVHPPPLFVLRLLGHDEVRSCLARIHAGPCEYLIEDRWRLVVSQWGNEMEMDMRNLQADFSSL